MARHPSWTGAIAAAFLSCAHGVAPAQDFYNGKTLRIVVGSEPSGAYDAYARLVAQHIGDHIPGRPSVIVQNMPGASSIRATNYIYHSAPRDGTIIATTLSSIPTAPLTSPEGVQFDVTKLSWLGSITKDPFVGYVWKTSPVQTLEEAKTKQIVMAADAVGAAGADMSIVANTYLGFRFKIVLGYPTADIKLAMERGEVDGTFANAWASLKTTKPDWIRDRQVTIITQHGFQRHPELPDVPLFVDQAKTPEDRQMLELMLARQEFAKPYFGPPGLPAERLAILRRAFEATLVDPAFLADCARANLVVDQPMKAAELGALVSRLAGTPPSVIERINVALARFK